MPTVCARNSRNSIYLGYFRSAAILKSYYDNSGHQNWCKSILSFIAVMMTHIRCYIYIKLIQYGLTILKEYLQRNKKKYFLSVLRFYSHFHVFLLKPQLCLFAAFVFFSNSAAVSCLSAGKTGEIPHGDQWHFSPDKVDYSFVT